MMKEFNTLDDFDFRDKTVLLRVDINCPLDRESLIITNDSRIRKIAPTVTELSSKSAKLVILAHQSRKGKWDFIPLQQHAEALARYTRREVRFVPDIIGNPAQAAIRSMQPGEIILLDNVRNLDCETEKKSMQDHSQSELVKALAPLADYYICDAFGAAHRSQCSLVGFQARLPSAAGRLMAKELYALRSVFDEPRRPSTFILGGAKFGDSSPMIDHVLGTGKADRVILVGLAGNAFIKAMGVDLGSASEAALKEEFTDANLQAAKQMLQKYGPRILLPQDIAVEKDGERVEVPIGDLPYSEPALDIGKASMEKFCKVIQCSGTCFMSGPAGMYEKVGFGEGTKALMLAMIDSGGQAVIGGGHTVGAADLFDLTDRFSYVSTAGGALETYLLGKPLPAVEALKHSCRCL
ncbi:MAG: phosphoglycerate kinase [Candidatus Methanomethylophilaceae archaeon]|nr:phosphoglycerate kinase [Candidatus Methanomethylophilaceae archaeon]